MFVFVHRQEEAQDKIKNSSSNAEETGGDRSLLFVAAVVTVVDRLSSVRTSFGCLVLL